MNIKKSIVDYLLYAVVVGLSLYLYLLVSNFWGIFTVFAGIILILVYLLFTTPGMLVKIKYRRIIQLLKTQLSITESEIQNKITIDKLKLHKALYEIAKAWMISPLVLLIKKQYLYVSEKVMDEIVSIVEEYRNNLQQQSKSSSKIMRSQLISELSQQYTFMTRLQIETIISHLIRQLE
ncbi:MAG: hypothetical protein K9W44_06420 [Candidatus Lokiarchaeota archaeon]|nr:hypothetical protein [Candidatus Harpocratesius repetitus]